MFSMRPFDRRTTVRACASVGLLTTIVACSGEPPPDSNPERATDTPSVTATVDVPTVSTMTNTDRADPAAAVPRVETAAMPSTTGNASTPVPAIAAAQTPASRRPTAIPHVLALSGESGTEETDTSSLAGVDDSRPEPITPPPAVVTSLPAPVVEPLTMLVPETGIGPEFVPAATAPPMTTIAKTPAPDRDRPDRDRKSEAAPTDAPAGHRSIVTPPTPNGPAGTEALDADPADEPTGAPKVYPGPVPAAIATTPPAEEPLAQKDLLQGTAPIGVDLEPAAAMPAKKPLRVRLVWDAAATTDLGYYIYYGNGGNAVGTFARRLRVDDARDGDVMTAMLDAPDEIVLSPGEPICFAISAWNAIRETERSPIRCVDVPAF